MRRVIVRLSDMVRSSRLISLNISLLASRNGTRDANNNAAIQVVAADIQRLNDESGLHIEELNRLLFQVKDLTRTINLAGRQRMLSQKIMKLFLIRQLKPAAGAEEMLQTMKIFDAALLELQCSPLVTPGLAQQLHRMAKAWQDFRAAIDHDDVDGAIVSNETLLLEAQKTVVQFEALCGSAG